MSVVIKLPKWLRVAMGLVFLGILILGAVKAYYESHEARAKAAKAIIEHSQTADLKKRADGEKGPTAGLTGVPAPGGPALVSRPLSLPPAGINSRSAAAAPRPDGRHESCLLDARQLQALISEILAQIRRINDLAQRAQPRTVPVSGPAKRPVFRVASNGGTDLPAAKLVTGLLDEQQLRALKKALGNQLEQVREGRIDQRDQLRSLVALVRQIHDILEQAHSAGPLVEEVKAAADEIARECLVRLGERR